MLPNDIARCGGKSGHERCNTCRRREPSNPGRRQVYMSPLVDAEFIEHGCPDYIEPFEPEHSQ